MRTCNNSVHVDLTREDEEVREHLRANNPICDHLSKSDVEYLRTRMSNATFKIMMISWEIVIDCDPSVLLA